MSRLCIIPARGGSKRIPRKNIKPFLGKPIMAYSIEAALESGLFDEVMVSTDDEEIAELARKYGAEVPFMRSRDNANDYATTVDVLKEVHKGYSRNFDEACCVYATAPFVTADLLQRSQLYFDIRELPTVFPVLRYGFPIQRALRVNDDGYAAMFDPSQAQTRSQDLTPAYHDAGMFYWYRPQDILDGGSLYAERSGVIIVPELEAHDIDTPEDWRVAEFKYQLKHAR